VRKNRNFRLKDGAIGLPVNKGPRALPQIRGSFHPRRLPRSAHKVNMGAIEFSTEFTSFTTRHGASQGRSNNRTHPDGFGEAASEVPGPGTKGISRGRKRLSPAAVIAGSLAPDASSLSPTEIIARSVNSAFGNAAQHQKQPEPAAEIDQIYETPQGAPTARDTSDSFAEFWGVWIENHDYLFKQSLRFMAGNMADAEDALSQAMIKGSQHFDSTTILNERAWLTRLVHNSCMDQHRSRKRQLRLSEEVWQDDTEDVPTLAPQAMRAPDEALHMNQVFGELEHQLQQLPITLLEPLMMRVIEERSYDDIAQHLGLSNCAVRKRIQLARDRLRKMGTL